MAATRFKGDRVVLLGALGDLARRHLLPALAHLHRGGLLSPRLHIVGVDRTPMTTPEFRAVARGSLDHHAATVPKLHRSAVVDKVEYLAADLDGGPDLTRVLGDHPVVVYLALPPGACPGAAHLLRIAGLADGSRIVAEKPFGHDRSSARQLTAILEEAVGEENVFRADHFLHHQVVQDILAFRLSSGPFESAWNATHVTKVEVAWEERSGVAGGGTAYDTVGALLDMVQSHLLQALAVVAMEPPAALDPVTFRAEKVRVLRQLREMTIEEVSAHSQRGRYTDGVVAGRPMAAYVDEHGVDPARQTETWASAQLQVDSPRWRGVPFVLRTGKAVGHPQRHISVHFRTSVGGPSRILRFSADQISFDVAVAGRRGLPETQTGQLAIQREQRRLPPSARLMRDVLAGDQTFCVSADEVEECWRVVESITDGWHTGDPPLQDYAAGSPGPPARAGCHEL